jgi:hypothetical protein
VETSNVRSDTVPYVTVTALPRRDEHARDHLDRAARRARPLVLAGERVVPVPGPLGGLIPGGVVQRGTVVAVDGSPGAGSTSVALQLAAAATAAGEWAVGVELEAARAGGLGGLAAREAGVALAQFAVVRRVPPSRWAAVVAALLDGVGMVVAEVPLHARDRDARRLLARARERGAVLVTLGSWPVEAALRLRAEGSIWYETATGAGVLGARDLRVEVVGRGKAVRGYAATG